MLFGRYVWSPKIYVGLVYYLLCGKLLVFMFGKRLMEATVVKICKRYETVQTKGTFKTRRHKPNKFISQQYMQ